jgi:hypothetical protein
LHRLKESTTKIPQKVHGDRGHSPIGGGICWPARSKAGKKVEHDLVKMLVEAVCAVLVGADDLLEIEE